MYMFNIKKGYPHTEDVTQEIINLPGVQIHVTHNESLTQLDQSCQCPFYLQQTCRIFRLQPVVIISLCDYKKEKLVIIESKFNDGDFTSQLKLLKLNIPGFQHNGCRHQEFLIEEDLVSLLE